MTGANRPRGQTAVSPVILAGLMQVKPEEKDAPADEQQEQEAEPETEEDVP